MSLEKKEFTRKIPTRTKSFDDKILSPYGRSSPSPRRGRRPVNRMSSGGSLIGETIGTVGVFTSAGSYTIDDSDSACSLSETSNKDDGDFGGYNGYNRYFRTKPTGSRSSSDAEDDSGMRKPRHSAFKQENEMLLKDASSKINDVKESGFESGKLAQHLFKDRAQAGRRRVVRRASMSSVESSQSSNTGVSASMSADMSIDIIGELKNEKGHTSFASQNSHSQQHLSSTFMMHQSSMTLPVANIVKTDSGRRSKQKLKTDQIIESIVWFSFHIPRTVLEDLISHELDLWRGEQCKSTIRQRNQDSARSQTTGNISEDSDNNSSASEDGHQSHLVLDASNFSENLLRLTDKRKGGSDFMTLPKCTERESALLFVDMSGFTKLSTILDVESLSKVINAYFDMIVSEVIQHGGDILKFAGDAFFAEWRVAEDETTSDDEGSNPLAELNASLASVGEIAWEDDDDIPKISTCALMAARCAIAIVSKYSDYHVTMTSTNKSEAMLNVHCGLGVGKLSGLHLGDFKDDAQEEDAVELRREFLILGDPIEQVSRAEEIAQSGEVYASPEAMLALAYCCDMSDEQRIANSPVMIASRNKVFIDMEPDSMVGGLPHALQPYESLRMHCKALNYTALARLHLQMALYVHPVIRGDELALSAAIQAGKISQPTATLESRHRAEAELRSVFTLFIKAIITPRVAGMEEIDRELYKTLANIMHITSRELDRYSGHLRQFIVDDKGVVLIATFGLRGSTFPNMVSNNALPATFAIHQALKNELHVENRIGATFGKVYCGVVGGVRRHEFAVMGAPVNLAARLMGSKVNKGIIVDEAISQQAGTRYSFVRMEPVQAKGYDKPVSIFEPLPSSMGKKRKITYPFTGRSEEKKTISTVARSMMNDAENSKSAMVFLTGESGVGKSALAAAVVEDIRKENNVSEGKKVILAAKSTSNETLQRIPLSSFRQVFLSLIRDHCEFDGSFPNDDTSSGQASHGSKEMGKVGGVASENSNSLLPRNTRSDHLMKYRSTPHLDLHLQDSSQSRQSSETEVDTHGSRPMLKKMKALRGNIGDAEVSEISESDNTTSQSLRCLLNQPSRLGDTGRRMSESGRRLSITGKQYLPGALSASTRHLGAENRSIHGDTTSVTTSYSRPTQPGAENLGQSLHRLSKKAEQSSLHPLYQNAASVSSFRSPTRAQSLRIRKNVLDRPDDSSATSFDVSIHRQTVSVPYFEKLCWICEKLDYPFEYADIVGSQFLGLESANPVTHIDGHVPTMDELVEYLALAFICITEFSDLTVVVLDDFQWADAFSWRIFRVLVKRGKKMLLICATRSHDKQALRRLSSAMTNETQLQNQMTEISLGPLDYACIRELIALVLDVDNSAVTEDLCTDIFQWTGGLPVLVVQVLENIRRKKTLDVINGVLKWTAEGLREKKTLSSVNNVAVMEETFLSRFDALDVRVRKVLQTCAVLGLKFSLTDVIQVHPEISESDIENALDTAVDEMILMEHMEDDEDTTSLRSGSLDDDDNTFANQSRSSKTSDVKGLDDRFFHFSHAMWRNNVLTTMLKERKIELHRLIAEAMERDQVMVLEQSDISRILTLFDHWKACGDFCKAAPLALAVGARLEEWDLSAQSLELYEDALELSFDSVLTADEEKQERNSEWVQVKARPMVLDLILRLHICIGLCHQRLGDPHESCLFFEDAFNIIRSASKVPGVSKSLMMPIISSLCVLKIEEDLTASEPDSDQEKLLGELIREAQSNGHPVHICRAYAIQATRFARNGNFAEAVDSAKKIVELYDLEKYGDDMISEYGSDYALIALAESVQWLYLSEQLEEAEKQANMVIDDLLPSLAINEIDDTMLVVLPLIQVLMLLDRVKDADWLLKTYIINPYHESGQVSFWSPLFNPLAYVLELILMEETEQYDPDIVHDLESWVLDENNSNFDMDIERKAHTLMGELCWRLAYNKDDDDATKELLIERARSLLTPIARYPHPEVFLKHTARALLEAL